MNDKEIVLYIAALVAIATLLLTAMYMEVSKETESRAAMRECMEAGARWDDCHHWVSDRYPSNHRR